MNRLHLLNLFSDDESESGESPCFLRIISCERSACSSAKTKETTAVTVGTMDGDYFLRISINGCGAQSKDRKGGVQPQVAYEV